MSAHAREADGTPGSSSERIPHKPTQEVATAANTPEDALGQRQEPTGADAPDHLGRERQEVGNREASSAHPPYVPSQDRQAEIQDQHESPDDVPVLPANASGKDRVGAEEQNEEIDEESMYDGRPERDKDRPPSERA